MPGSAERVDQPEPAALTCANGEPWLGPHPLCDAEADLACTQFWLAVSAGTYNGRGYTPAEWRAKVRREQQRHDDSGKPRGDRQGATGA